jgi:hypothetical protein
MNYLPRDGFNLPSSWSLTLLGLQVGATSAWLDPHFFFLFVILEFELRATTPWVTLLVFLCVCVCVWWVFSDRVSQTVCEFGLALNHIPPDLCLLSSWDYRCEPLAPGLTQSFKTKETDAKWTPCFQSPLMGTSKGQSFVSKISF